MMTIDDTIAIMAASIYAQWLSDGFNVSEDTKEEWRRRSVDKAHKLWKHVRNRDKGKRHV